MGHARVHFEGSDPFFRRLADRLVQIGSGLYCGFPLLVCHMCGKAATTGLANVSCNREIRRGIRAERCSRARNQAVGVALLMASQAVLAQEPLYDIDIPSLNAAEALNELGPVNTNWPDYVTFQVWNLPKLNTNALRRICHYSAETSGFLTAKCSTPSCMSPNRDASGAGCRPGLETGTPSTPE